VSFITLMSSMNLYKVSKCLLQTWSPGSPSEHDSDSGTPFHVYIQKGMVQVQVPFRTVSPYTHVVHSFSALIHTGDVKCPSRLHHLHTAHSGPGNSGAMRPLLRRRMHYFPLSCFNQGRIPLPTPLLQEVDTPQQGTGPFLGLSLEAIRREGAGV
jgi:hypothetical protein